MFEDGSALGPDLLAIRGGESDGLTPTHATTGPNGAVLHLDGSGVLMLVGPLGVAPPASEEGVVVIDGMGTLDEGAGQPVSLDSPVRLG